ncbi:MAG: PHB depolymerase family esterase [Myxococcales bacterium]
MPTRWLAVPLVLALGACGSGPTPQRELATRTQALMSEVSSFGSNPGALRMFSYVPGDMPSGKAPLVVALHGCYQTAAVYHEAGWKDVADRYKFYVVYPQIDANSNCFHWFDPTENARDEGEAASIKQMIDKMAGDYAIDSSRVFVTGLSSGGAMAAALLAGYPDVFAAGATLAGIPVGCATNMTAGFNCMYGIGTHTAQEWGDFVRDAYPSFGGEHPRVSIWQGTSDGVVDFDNFGKMVAQWSNVHGLGSTANATETEGIATHKEYRDGQGRTLVESWELNRMGHGTPVDPQSGCGKAADYVLDVSICSSERIAEFFGIANAPGPDAGAGLDATVAPPPPDADTVAGPDAETLEQPDASDSLDAGKDAGRRDASQVPPVDPGQCNCGVANAGAPESVLALLALAGLLRHRLRR